MSAPLDGAKGNIVSNGLEVSNKKDKKPTKINEIIPMLFDLSTSLLSTLVLNKYPHAAKKIIHRNIDPSWALQIEEIL
jgi:hypothetical protein